MGCAAWGSRWGGQEGDAKFDFEVSSGTEGFRGGAEFPAGDLVYDFFPHLIFFIFSIFERVFVTFVKV